MAAYAAARPRDPAAVRAATSWPQPSRGSADVAELGRALAASRHELGAARRQMDQQRVQDSLLERHVVLLEQALAKAGDFAYRDELTGLPNRRLLLDRFNQAEARGARQHKQVAVLFLDLDGFETVNDVLGHAAGDRLLQQVATRLIACIRGSDTACRWGGDEFVILLPELETNEHAAVAAARIGAQLAAPYDMERVAVKMTISIGMAIYPFDGEDYADLLRAADRAMRLDKAHGCAPPDFLEHALQTRR